MVARIYLNRYDGSGRIGLEHESFDHRVHDGLKIRPRPRHGRWFACAHELYSPTERINPACLRDR